MGSEMCIRDRKARLPIKPPYQYMKSWDQAIPISANKFTTTYLCYNKHYHRIRICFSEFRHRRQSTKFSISARNVHRGSPRSFARNSFWACLRALILSVVSAGLPASVTPAPKDFVTTAPRPTIEPAPMLILFIKDCCQSRNLAWRFSPPMA